MSAAMISLASVSACDGPSEPSGDEEILAENRKRFRTSVGTSYDYDYRNVCFCVVDATRQVRIAVRGGVQTSITDAETGAVLPRARWEEYLTVEEIFDTLQQAFEDGAASVRVTYDPAFGYPRDVFIDYDERLADEERGFVVENLAVVR